MKKLYAFAAILLLFLPELVPAQTQLDVVGSVRFRSVSNAFGDNGNSDIWGWEAPDGEEYAIMGTLYGVHIVRTSDMAVIDSVEGPYFNDAFFHRDLKTYRNYAYVVAEMNGTNEGMMIIDLSSLPDSVHYVKSYKDSTNTTSHNMSIDTANAKAYVIDQNANGVRIISLHDPENPVDTGYVGLPNVHDIMVRNDTMWAAEGWTTAYSVWDVSNVSAPSKFASIVDPNFGYCHNIWPTKDGKHFITTEETADETVKIWDMTNPSNITKSSEFLAASKLAHNVHVEGDSAYVAHYASGIIVVDITNPSSPVTVGHYDTYPQNDWNQFLGCWGVYPHTSSGRIFTSNFEGWMYVLEFPADTTVSVVDHEPLIRAGAAWPNPSTETVNFPFHLYKSGPVRVRVFDLSGKTMMDTGKQPRTAGTFSESWNHGAEHAKPGLYFYEIETSDGVHRSKFVISR